jgi:hypothetical protein
MHLYVFGSGSLSVSDFPTQRDAAPIAARAHFLAFDFDSNAQRTSGTQRNIECCLGLGKVRLGAR